MTGCTSAALNVMQLLAMVPDHSRALWQQRSILGAAIENCVHCLRLEVVIATLPARVSERSAWAMLDVRSETITERSLLLIRNSTSCSRKCRESSVTVSTFQPPRSQVTFLRFFLLTSPWLFLLGHV